MARAEDLRSFGEIEALKKHRDILNNPDASIIDAQMAAVALSFMPKKLEPASVDEIEIKRKASLRHRKTTANKNDNCDWGQFEDSMFASWVLSRDLGEVALNSFSEVIGDKDALVELALSR